MKIFIGKLQLAIGAYKKMHVVGYWIVRDWGEGVDLSNQPNVPLWSSRVQESLSVCACVNSLSSLKQFINI